MNIRKAKISAKSEPIVEETRIFKPAKSTPVKEPALIGGLFFVFMSKCYKSNKNVIKITNIH